MQTKLKFINSGSYKYMVLACFKHVSKGVCTVNCTQISKLKKFTQETQYNKNFARVNEFQQYTTILQFSKIIGNCFKLLILKMINFILVKRSSFNSKDKVSR